MQRVAWRFSLFVVVSLPCSVSAQPVPLPRDTLPAKLALDTLPDGLHAKRDIPQANPLTEAKVQLGRKLFFDPILSADHTVSCASCHQPEYGFAGNSPVSTGVGGKKGKRNAPTLLNRAFGTAFFWDGREATLEAQALHPIASAQEMGSSVIQAIQRLQAHKEYPAQFQAAFPDGVTSANLAKALASFERVLVVGNSRVDQFRAGDLRALNDKERHGFWLYESRGRCWRCHGGPNFTDEGFHNTGVSWAKTPLDLGRYEHTMKEADRGKFKTPTLRGLLTTAPYMHDGSMATLPELVEFYNQGGRKNPYLDSALGPLDLSKEEVADLVAFLKALSDPLAIGTNQPGTETLRKKYNSEK
jgi:cytochrome c peroxidase